MFRRLATFVSRRPSVPASVPHDKQRIHGHVYCAALNIHRAAEFPLTALDADRLHRALAELHELGVAMANPADDLSDITSWRDHLGQKANELRKLAGPAVRYPDTSSVELYINTGIVNDARDQARRATA
jgi:hypothetical protein